MLPVNLVRYGAHDGQTSSRTGPQKCVPMGRVSLQCCRRPDEELTEEVLPSCGGAQPVHELRGHAVDGEKQAAAHSTPARPINARKSNILCVCNHQKRTGASRPLVPAHPREQAAAAGSPVLVLITAPPPLPLPPPSRPVVCLADPRRQHAGIRRPVPRSLCIHVCAPAGWATAAGLGYGRRRYTVPNGASTELEDHVERRGPVCARRAHRPARVDASAASAGQIVLRSATVCCAQGFG